MTRTLRLEHHGHVTPDGEFVSDWRRVSRTGIDVELHTKQQQLELDGLLIAHFRGKRVRVVIEEVEAPCQDQTPASSPTASLSASPSSRTKESKRTAAG